MVSKNYSKVGIISSVINERTGGLFLSNLVSILDTLCYTKIILVGGNINNAIYKSQCVYSVKYVRNTNSIINAILFVHFQFKIAYRIYKLRSLIDLWFFFVGSEINLIPMIVSRLLGKKCIIILSGSTQKNHELCYKIFYMPIVIITKLNHLLATGVVLYSPTLIENWNLESSRQKILIAREHFLDLDKFKIETHFNERNKLVGYIGRFSEEKGVMNFIKAAPKLVEAMPNLSLSIIGDGQQEKKIEKYIQNNNLYNWVELSGWIPHNMLSKHLNRIKLIIIPSYTEGLPNIMLEAMACGTPVLMTPVGAIPDFIKDRENGYILKENTPECISKTVNMVLASDLERVSVNGRMFVSENFSFRKIVESWKEILKKNE